MRRSLLALAAAALVIGGCTTEVQPSTPAAPPKPAGPQAGSPMTASGKARIALLLPLTGRAAAIGQAMQQAAEMSLFDSGGRDIALASYDTGDTPDGAVQAYAKARTDGVALVLGPLFGPSAKALAPAVQKNGVNVIAFSNDESAAQPGVWVMGIAAAPQVRRVAEYAMTSGIRRFAVFAPQSSYGEEMARTLESYLAVHNATAVAVELFPAQALDLSAPAQRLARELKGDGKLAVLVPVGPPRLSAVLSALSNAGVDASSVQFIGTGVWDVPGIGSVSELKGAWYAAPDPARRADFERKFTATYGRPPQRLATLAYDAVALAAQLARRKPGGDFSAEAITNANGWAGVDGAFRLLPDGRSERALAVIEVQADRTLVVSPAPGTFASTN